jgi:hypothetical protein
MSRGFGKVERRAGELLRANPHLGSGKPLTLRGLGVERNQSHRWKTIASLPAPAFEAHIAHAKAASKELTSAAVYRKARQYQPIKLRLRAQALGILCGHRAFGIQ